MRGAFGEAEFLDELAGSLFFFYKEGIVFVAFEKVSF